MTMSDLVSDCGMDTKNTSEFTNDKMKIRQA